MQDKPLVSVIIPTYNHARFISEAIESVLKQDYPQDKIEIIVIDDGSTDNTKKVVKKYKKVRYFYQKNSGQAWALRNGIKKAKGEYIFTLNADDSFLRKKLSRTVKVFGNNLDIVHVGNPTYIVKNNNKIKEKIPPTITDKKIKGKNLMLFFYKNNKFYGGGSNIAGRSSLMKEVNIKKDIYMYPDEFIVISLLAKGDSYFFKEPLTIYRIHDSNYSEIDVKKKKKNIIAIETILGDMKKNHFPKEIISLYELKTLTTKLRFKEQTNKKTIKDIVNLWRFILENSLFNPKLLINYAVFQRSCPQFLFKRLKK